MRGSPCGTLVFDLLGALPQILYRPDLSPCCFSWERRSQTRALDSTHVPVTDSPWPWITNIVTSAWHSCLSTNQRRTHRYAKGQQPQVHMAAHLQRSSQGTMMRA